MEHLACFAPGMLAIGSKVLDRPQGMAVAKSLLEGCMFMYAGTASGLVPESVYFATEDSYRQLERVRPDLAQQINERGFYIDNS
ncbi:hypothetical protein H4R33_007216, partial [Dimargaris cristalligena]